MKYEVLIQVSGTKTVVVEAENEDDAMDQAREEVYCSDWNDIGCPDVEVLDWYPVKE